MRWDIRNGERAGYIEDAVVTTVAGFANSDHGGTVLAGVADDATLSKRGQRGDRDLRGQHLHNLLGHRGSSSATPRRLGVPHHRRRRIARIRIEPSARPVYETKADHQTFWWRTP